MQMKAEINGWEQMSNLLKEFPERIQRDIVNSAASAGATVVKNKAKQNIKANGSVDSGDLHGSVRTRKKKKVHGIYEVFTDKSAPHSHLVEFGTGPRKLKEPKQVEIQPGKWVTVEYTGSMPAKPFFRPALDENHKLVMRKITERMAKRMAVEAQKMSQRYGTLSKTYRKKLLK